MDKIIYAQIRQQLNSAKPLWITLAIITADLLLLWVAFYLLRFENVAAFVISQMLIAVFIFHNFAILHECGHGNVHKQRIINSLVGHYCSLLCFLPYFSWRYIYQPRRLGCRPFGNPTWLICK